MRNVRAEKRGLQATEQASRSVAAKSVQRVKKQVGVTVCYDTAQGIRGTTWHRPSRQLHWYLGSTINVSRFLYLLQAQREECTPRTRQTVSMPSCAAQGESLHKQRIHR
jgi:hypothetical protein